MNRQTISSSSSADRWHVSIRAIVSIAACFAVLSGTVLRLNSGMVLCFDEHGHLALEPAHLLHARAHADGADHHHDDFGGDLDHPELHAAMARCVDVSQRQDEPRPGVQRITKLAPSPVLFVSDLFLQSPLRSAGTASRHFRAPAARAQLASLRAVVLIV
jgi:hypothetical protein